MLPATQLLVTAALGSQLAAVAPKGFSDEPVVSIDSPTALAFTPDGRMLVTARGGQLRIVQNGALLPEPALDIGGRICTNAERGLLGVAVDPEFATNQFVYLYYTAKTTGECPEFKPDSAGNPVNRLSRFTLIGNVIDPASATTLIDNIPSPSGVHNAGDLQFGKDGYLYISVGDGGCDYDGENPSSRCNGNNDAARDQHVLLGKILRITRDGGIPPDNPFVGPNSARCHTTGRTDAGKQCQETFAWGLRNPFRMAFDPNAAETRFFINDVGQNAREEINDGRAGADYGWIVREGKCWNGWKPRPEPCDAIPAGMTDPIYDYQHSDTTYKPKCTSVTGGAFVPNDV